VAPLAALQSRDARFIAPEGKCSRRETFLNLHLLCLRGIFNQASAWLIPTKTTKEEALWLM
jgi:hypothetical protein